MKNTERIETSTATPLPRLRLKGQVFTAGYPTITDLASELGIHRTSLSRVLNGHEFPTPKVQRRLAEKLGLTIKELKQLL